MDLSYESFPGIQACSVDTVMVWGGDPWGMFEVGETLADLLLSQWWMQFVTESLFDLN